MADPILIVGAGPTGLTAALELTRHAVPVRVIDKRAGPDTTSRAIGVQARTLELFEQRGLVDEMLSLGNKSPFASVYGGGKRIFRMDFSHVESRYPYILFLSQVETERILREALAKHGVVPEWRTELVAIAQTGHDGIDGSAQAVLRTPDGNLNAVATPWLIGADGAHSVVRSTLALPYDGHTRNEHYALGDAMIDGDLPDTDLHIFSSDHGFLGLFPLGGAHFRMIASHPVEDAAKAGPAPTLEALQRIYDQRAPIKARMRDLSWSAWFRINSRMVSRLKVGRMLMGGDAAHIHSPAGAQGMNTGIQDMVDLGWKLARVMHGKASPALLDTYEAERLPIMRGLLARTDHLTTAIGTENPLVRMLFDHVGPFLGGNGIVQENATATMSQVALHYRKSPLSEQHGHLGQVQAGDRMPDLIVRPMPADGSAPSRLLPLLDALHFTLVVASASVGIEPRAWLEALPDLRIVFIAPPPGAAQQARFFHALGRELSVSLVRPDGYVAMRCALSEASERLTAYSEKWLASAAPG